GVNAVYQMAVLLGHIQRFADHLRTTRIDPLLGPATLSVGMIAGGTSVNTVPDRCQIEIDRRTLPGDDPAQAPGELFAYLQQQVGRSIDFECSPPWLSCPALGPERSAELVQQLGQAIDSVAGSHQVESVPYGTDASTLALAGIPSVVFGPGDIGRAHTCDE